MQLKATWNEGAQSNALDGQRHGIAATQAESRDAFGCAALRHRIKQRHQHARAAGADGVADGHRSAMHVHFGGIQAQFAIHSQCLHAERLVQLEEVHIAKRPTGFHGHFAHRLDGRQAQPFRLAAAGGLGANHGQRFQTQFPGLLCTRNHHCRGAVADSRRVACGDGAALFEGRLETRENLYCCPWADGLVGFEDARLFALLGGRNLDGENFVAKETLRP